MSGILTDLRASARDGLGAPSHGGAEAERATEHGERLLRLALLGCGTVGTAVARLVHDESRTIARRSGVRPIVTAALVRHTQRDRGVRGLNVTDDFQALCRTKPDVVIEVLGGVEPARGYVSHLLRSGISVASANKSMVAESGPELSHIARQSGARFVYEPAICAAVPVLDAARQLRGEPMTHAAGILNGTCNAVLTQMERKGCSRAEAIADAQQRGLAEPDPSADLSGRDSAEKLVILARALGWAAVSTADVSMRGICDVTVDDVRFARRRGASLRFLAVIEVDVNSRPRLRIGPALLPRSHCLAGLKGEENGIMIETPWRGALFFCGIGAGPRPTAAALLGDVLAARASSSQPTCSTDGASPPRASARENDTPEESGEPAEPARYYIRLPATCCASPDQCLNVMAAHGVDVGDIELTNDGCFLMTRESNASAVDDAVNALTAGEPASAFVARAMSSRSRADTSARSATIQPIST